jgi:glutathione S-transferase
MSKPRLTYFDAPVSRGEECRLALHLAGVDFEDVRVKTADWPALKPTTPYGVLPLLEIPGKPVLAQSNAILVYIGRRWNLHPKDDFEAAQHEAIMQHVEDLRGLVGPTIRIKDETEKKRVREGLVETYFPGWAVSVEKQLGDGPFVAGSAVHVADLKLHMIVRWFIGGKVDYVPATVFAAYPKLNRVHDAVRDHAGVRAWYAKT